VRYIVDVCIDLVQSLLYVVCVCTCPQPFLCERELSFFGLKDELDGKMSSCFSRLQTSHYIYTRTKIIRDMYLSYKLQQNIDFYL
jgi:hypothetical protein